MKNGLVLTGVLSAIALSACQPDTAPKPDVASQPKVTEAPKHTHPPTAKPSVDPHVTESIAALGTATIARESSNRDEHDKAVEPFTDATVIFSTPGVPLKDGANIFMWPLRTAPPPMNVKVTEVRSTNACNGSNQKMFAMSGVPERKVEILGVKPDAGKSAEFPFEMAYVIPSQPNAKLVQPPSELPPGITLATVKFALDLNSDAHADALYVTSDCDTGGAVSDDTGAVCTASYVMKEQKWVMLDSTSPC